MNDTKAASYPTPHELFRASAKEVRRLIKIHEEFRGKGPGFKYDVEVLNKSAIVFLVACLEAFLEDLAKTAFDILLSRAKDPHLFPNKVLVGASKELWITKDEREVWKLAGEGWKKVLEERKQDVIEQLNTPKPDQVNALFEALLGIKKISSSWHWPGCSVKNSTDKLEELVELRGDIVHRVKTSRKIYKKAVKKYAKVVNRIAMKTSNATCEFLYEKLGERPWDLYLTPGEVKRIKKAKPEVIKALYPT